MCLSVHSLSTCALVSLVFSHLALTLPFLILKVCFHCFVYRLDSFEVHIERKTLFLRACTLSLYFFKALLLDGFLAPRNGIIIQFSQASWDFWKWLRTQLPEQPINRYQNKCLLSLLFSQSLIGMSYWLMLICSDLVIIAYELCVLTF